MAVGTVVFGESVGVLAAIHEPRVQMAVWNRPSPFRPGDLGGPLDFHCDGVWIVPSAAAPAWLVDDIQLLGELFSALSFQPMWRAGCEIVTSRTCPAFHQDGDSLRIITTYAGPATEWIFASDLNDVADPGAGFSPRRLFPGQVVALKGRQFEGADAPGAVLHRSPPASRRSPRVFCAVRAAATVPWLEDSLPPVAALP